MLQAARGGQTALDLAIKEGHEAVVYLLKAQYNKIASSLLESETNIADFSNDQLNVLERHVRNGDYTKEDKQEILEKLKEIRFNRSQNIGLKGGSPSDAGEISEILRLREGSSLVTICGGLQVSTPIARKI